MADMGTIRPVLTADVTLVIKASCTSSSTRGAHTKISGSSETSLETEPGLSYKVAAASPPCLASNLSRNNMDLLRVVVPLVQTLNNGNKARKGLRAAKTLRRASTTTDRLQNITDTYGHVKKSGRAARDLNNAYVGNQQKSEASRRRRSPSPKRHRSRKGADLPYGSSDRRQPRSSERAPRRFELDSDEPRRAPRSPPPQQRYAPLSPTRRGTYRERRFSEDPYYSQPTRYYKEPQGPYSPPDRPLPRANRSRPPSYDREPSTYVVDPPRRYRRRSSVYERSGYD
jgi:hypothetical protein